MNEWELLVTSEGIEPGDTLDVDEDGDNILMVFNSYRGGKVYCTGSEGIKRSFRATNLEEVNGTAFIVKKSDEELELDAT